MFSLTIKHYFRTALSSKINKNLLSAHSWDCLRGDESNSFAIPRDRMLWEKKALEHPLLTVNAKHLAMLIMRAGYTEVYSFGVGAAGLELLLKREIPSLQIHCFDYAKVSVDILKSLFVEAKEIAQFDILKDDFYPVKENALYLLYRVDTEFSDDEWRGIFRKLFHAQVSNVIFFPERMLTVKDIARESLKKLLFYFRNDFSFAGYYRTEKRFRELWGGLYEVADVRELGLSKCFHLKIIG